MSTPHIARFARLASLEENVCGRYRMKKKATLPPGIRPQCPWCGKLLPVFSYWEGDFWRERGAKWGYNGNNIFCTKECGYRYGLARAKERNA